jgi:D-glycero-D-manno-heptose 1,7-bisphosphate phosphatase
MNRAVFLDRDGVLNVPVVRDGRPYPPFSPAEFRLYPEAEEACTLLRRAGFLLVVVTNQPDVGRGTQSRQAVEEMHAILTRIIPLDRVEVCTAANDQTPDSRRRKPAPGMLLDAARELGLVLPHSYMIGDRWRDISAGHAAGCKTIFIDRGYDEPLRQPPHYRCTDLLAAAQWIVQIEQSASPSVSQPPLTCL